MARTHHDSPVVRITTAPVAPQIELRRRQRRYLISMSIRVVCFGLAIITSGWLRWTMVAGAAILPYVAVVMANAANRADPTPPLLDGRLHHRELH